MTVFGSARLPESHPAYAAAVEFSRRMAEAGWMVITGAASGIMEAGHVGAGREKSIGVNILLPFEQEANPIIRGDLKLMHLKYFFTRKLLFVKESDAVALFPGGFGTQDECFEVLTLVQTGKSQIFPIVMVDEPGGDYWVRWREYIEDELLARELISPADMSLFKVTDSVDEAVAEVLQFLSRLSQHALRPRRIGAASPAPARRRAAGAHPRRVRRHRRRRHVRADRGAAGGGQRDAPRRTCRVCAFASIAAVSAGCGR